MIILLNLSRAIFIHSSSYQIIAEGQETHQIGCSQIFFTALEWDKNQFFNF